MTDVHALIDEMKQCGIQLEARGDHLHINAPARVFKPHLRQTLLDHKSQILSVLAHYDAEVDWRAGVMRSQVPDRGPEPFLLARPAALTEDAPGLCMSCNDPLTPGRIYRCAVCVRAVETVLNERREA